AVDPRRYLEIRITYPDLIRDITYTVYSLEELVKQPLGVSRQRFDGQSTRTHQTSLMLLVHLQRGFIVLEIELM
ncbi:hypothetical protein A1O7_05907, partial [Cladophialophora yegresii CBS 114405]